MFNEVGPLDLKANKADPEGVRSASTGGPGPAADGGAAAALARGQLGKDGRPPPKGRFHELLGNLLPPQFLAGACPRPERSTNAW